MDSATQTTTEIEAAVFRRLLAHLDERKDVQNIDLMILAGFFVTVYPNGTRPPLKRLVKG